jgi:aryl-phospho-beta-D-glucosidase BglC (GH1 family)
MSHTRTRLALAQLDSRIMPTGIDTTPATEYRLMNDWGSGFQAEIALVNDQPTNLKDWRLTFDYGREIGQIWNAKVLSKNGTRYEIGGAAYNATLAPGAVVSIGFLGSGGSTSASPTNVTLLWDDGIPAPPPTSPPPPTASNAAVTFTVDNRWNTGFTATVAIRNTGTATVSGWTLGFDAGFSIANIWNGSISGRSGTRYTIRDAGYNSVIQPGQTVTFGFQGTGTPNAPTNYTFNGVALGGTPPTPAPLPVIAVNDVTVTEPMQSTVASGWLRASGNQIVDAAGMPVRLAGVNWFGMESSTFAPHGLWTRGYKEMMDQMKAEGFNTIRLPFSNQLFDNGSTPNGIDFSKNPDLVGLNGLQIMDKIVNYAGQLGLRILLDHHRSGAGAGAEGSGLWYTSAYPESRWISDWTMLASRYANNPTVVGADLHNEPHGPATWGTGGTNDWRLAAERAGNAILAVNPNWLIVVEGVESGPSGNYWWGGNLSAAGANPVRLNVPGRLVYSPHDYPSTVYPQPWFSAANYPSNLPSVWDANWGYLYKQNIAPILLGEFGTKHETASDRAWLSALVDYLGATAPAGQPQGPSWTYWSWNPNSGDTGGILADDWRTVNTAKAAALDPIEFGIIPATAATPGTVQAVFTLTLSAASSSPVTVKYATADGTATAGSDYIATSGTVTFAAGQTTATVTVTINADSLAEPDELFYLLLSEPLGGTLGTTKGIGTIRNA